jgi:hypothetical protein
LGRLSERIGEQRTGANRKNEGKSRGQAEAREAREERRNDRG